MTRPTRWLARARRRGARRARRRRAVRLLRRVQRRGDPSRTSRRCSGCWRPSCGNRCAVTRAAIVVPPLADPRARRARARAARRALRALPRRARRRARSRSRSGLMPPPANLAYTAREWTPAELFWVVKNGIKMTGMPAWEYRLADDDLWAIVAYLADAAARNRRPQYRATRAEATRATAARPPAARARARCRARQARDPPVRVRDVSRHSRHRRRARHRRTAAHEHRAARPSRRA